MSPLVSALRSALLNIVKTIDEGDCDISDEEVLQLTTVVKDFTHRDKPISKYRACEYLNVSRATFDNYVAQGKLPKGVHEQGFKELFWYKKDLDKFKNNCKNKL